MSSLLHSLPVNPLSAFLTAFFAGTFAIIAIIFKDRFDFGSEKQRLLSVLRSETLEVAEHFKRNVERVDSMLSALKNSNGLWPEKVHIEKLIWPEDSAFFNNNIPKFMSTITSENIRKFRLRVRNANLDAAAALRIYALEDDEALIAILEYVRERSLRLIALAPGALGERNHVEAFIPKIVNFEDVKDMVFLPKHTFFSKQLDKPS